MTLYLRILACLALVGLLTMASPPVLTEAWAQTAKNLKCPKPCVDGKEIKKKAVKKKNIAPKSVGRRQLDKKLQNKLDDLMMNANRAEFSARINANAERDLLVFGTFVLFARCVLGSTGDARLDLLLRSTVGGWFPGGFSSSPFPSTAEILLGTLFAVAGAQLYQTFEQPGGISPTGAVLGLIFFGLGLNVLNNACVVHGWADTGQT